MLMRPKVHMKVIGQGADARYTLDATNVDRLVEQVCSTTLYYNPQVYCKAVRMTLLALGFDKACVERRVRDALYAQYGSTNPDLIDEKMNTER